MLDLSLSLVDPGHDRVRTLVRPGSAGHARAGADSRRARRDPGPEDDGAPRQAGRGRPRRWPVGWSGTATARCACWRSERWSRSRRARQTCLRNRASTRPCGTYGWWRHPIPYMLADAAAHSLVVTIEDGIRTGGAGTFLVDAMRSLPELDRPLPPVRMLGLPLEYIPQGKPDAILARLGLDAAGVTALGHGGSGHRARAPAPRLSWSLASRLTLRAHRLLTCRPDRNLFYFSASGVQPRRPLRGRGRRLR